VSFLGDRMTTISSQKSWLNINLKIHSAISGIPPLILQMVKRAKFGPPRYCTPVAFVPKWSNVEI